MNKTQFAEILKNPGSVNDKTLLGIKEIIEEYPFFQIGRMLWLKNLNTLDSIKYNSELKNSSAYIADRTKLYQLINNISKPNPKAAIIEVEKPKIEETNNTIVEEKQVEEEKPIQKQADPSISITDNYLNASDDFSDDDGNVYSFTSNTKTEEKENAEIQDIVLPAADLLDYEMTSSSGYSLPKLEDVKEVDPNENRSFSDWLHIMHYSAPKEEKEETVPHAKGMDLIDNFLNSKPQIIPDPAKKAKDVDLSEKSSSAEEDILSETLAKIYIKQGHKSKAIAIFEKLRLKYPEKNVYFARRIKELKEN